MKLGFEGRRSLRELVMLYVKNGNVAAAAMLYLIARHGRITLSRLMAELARLGLEVSKPRLLSLLSTWRIHRFVDCPVRGLYAVGPSLAVSQEDLDVAREVLRSCGVNVD